jgi:hypothetical protein
MQVSHADNRLSTTLARVGLPKHTIGRKHTGKRQDIQPSGQKEAAYAQDASDNIARQLVLVKSGRNGDLAQQQLLCSVN